MALATDVISAKDSPLLQNAQTVTTNTFTTASGNQVLLAFVASSSAGTGTTTTTSTSVGGSSLTWVLRKRQSNNGGCAEIWSAFTASGVTNETATATLTCVGATGGTSITVVSFTGADLTGTNGSGAIGATNGASTASGTLSANVTTTRNNSWVFGVGHNWSSAVAITMGGSQTLVHEYTNTTNGDDEWVQRQTSTTPTSGTVVTINMTAPTGIAGDLAIVELLPASASVTVDQIMAAMGPTNIPLFDRYGILGL